jgi:hypothetical protein
MTDIGASGASFGGNTKSGASYVVFGTDAAMPADFNFADLNGTNGFQVVGAADFDLSGRSVSSAGDVNGDGFDDLFIGAYSVDYGSNSDYGAGYVVFGKAGGWGTSLELSTLDGSNGFRVLGDGDLDYAGWSVSSAGDINGDGLTM